MKNVKKVLSLLLVLSLVFSISCINVSATEVQYSENLIPAMTSSTTPSGQVIFSSQDATQMAFKAFDHMASEFIAHAWWSGNVAVPQWIGYEFTSPKKVEKYALTSYALNSNYDPKAWSFEAWDGSQWVVLDQRTNEIFTQQFHRKEYTFTNSTSYTKYRLYITQTKDVTNGLCLTELEMMEAVQAAPDAPANLTATAGNAQVSLTWAASTGATSYNIKRATTAGGPYTTLSTTSNLSYTDTVVTNGTNYYYVVSASNVVESVNSNQVSATPIAAGGNKAILELTMTNGFEKEYELTSTELETFLNWYDGRSNGLGKAYYIFVKKNAIKPFLSRKEYIAYDKILSFEVKDYND